MSLFKKSLLTIVVASILVPVSVLQADGLMLEEVIVTAQKRSESMQDVPIAITAATESQLKQAGIYNVQDLAMVNSSVIVTDAFSYVFPFIRGIGSFIPGGAQKSSVGVYVDGVFQSRLQAGALELDNIQQIEILKGPQATLYGRNATGGTLKITTKTPRPGDELEGSVSATVGDYNNKRGTFYFAGGLSDTLAASISGSVAQRDGFTENLAGSNNNGNQRAYYTVFKGGFKSAEGKDLDNLDTWYVSAKLNWQPTENLQVVGSVYSTESKGTASSGLRQFNTGAAAATASFFTTLAGDPDLVLPPEFFKFGGEHKTYSHSDYTQFEGKGGQLVVDYDFGNLHLQSLSAFNDVFALNSSDILATQIPGAGFNGISMTEDFIQEFQLGESDGEGLDWLTGVSYIKEESGKGDDFTATLGLFFGNPSISSQAEWSIEAKSVFAEGYYDLTDSLSLTVGARYTEEVMKVTPIIDGVLSSFAPERIGVEEEYNDDAVNWRVVLDYDLGWGMVYGSFATGFKSGGIGVNNVAAGPYDAEELTSYEVGVKAEVLDGRGRLNAAFFMYDFQTIQALIVGGPTGGSSFVITGDQADLAGLEVEFDGHLTDRLSVQAGFTYLFEKEYADFAFPGQGINGDLDFIPSFLASGNDIAGAADLVVLLGAQYAVPLQSGGDITFAANINYNSGYYLTLTNDLGTGGLNDDAFTIINTRISYMSASEDWEVALWAKNITDEYYVRAGIVALGNAAKTGIDGQPQHFGITAKYSF